jgi:hypothetical protein
LVDRYNVKTFPKFIVIKTNEKKPIPYNGEFKFLPMFEFLNIYSEVFVPGGGSAADSAATKNWLTELVPELHQKSANDICLKVDSVICVILLNAGDKPYTLLYILVITPWSMNLRSCTTGTNAILTAAMSTSLCG